MDRWQTVKTYYRRPKFAAVDLLFGLISLFINPYRMCRKFAERRGEEEIYVYGETPYATYQKIAAECGVRAEDVWVEVGAGRGKGCFWLAHFVKCRVLGVEQIPFFVYVAKILKKIARMHRLQFACGDVQNMDLSQATLIYLYGNFPKFQIPLGAKVISISEPLEGSCVLKSFWVRYPWGRTRAFLQTF